MSSTRNTGGFWSGLAIAASGVVLVYFGIDFPNTNMQTFVYPELIGGGLLIIGCAVLAIGLIRILLSLFGSKPKS